MNASGQIKGHGAQQLDRSVQQHACTQSQQHTCTQKHLSTKRCPVCDEELFSDMDVCYGCLYDFTRNTPSVSSLENNQFEDEYEQKMLALGEDRYTQDVIPFDIPEETNTAAPAIPHVPVKQVSYLIRIHNEIIDVTIPCASALVVGRLESCDVVLHTKAVSRTHIRFIPTETGLYVEDQGATNAALLHGRAIKTPTKIEIGDSVNVCGTLFTLTAA